MDCVDSEEGREGYVCVCVYINILYIIIILGHIFTSTTAVTSTTVRPCVIAQIY